jgi:hypothetical protein
MDEYVLRYGYSRLDTWWNYNCLLWKVVSVVQTLLVITDCRIILSVSFINSIVGAIHYISGCYASTGFEIAQIVTYLACRTVTHIILIYILWVPKKRFVVNVLGLQRGDRPIPYDVTVSDLIVQREAQYK